MTAVGRTHVESTTGPVAVGGRTISLVARSTTLTLGRTQRELATWSRPHHVEILDQGGQREVVRVHDAQMIGAALVAVAIAAGTAAVTLFARRTR